MIYKFLIIIFSLSLFADDENAKSAVTIDKSQLSLQSFFKIKEKSPTLPLPFYPKDMTGIDNITGYQGHKDSELVNIDAKKLSSQDLKASKSSQSLSSVQLLDAVKSAHPKVFSILMNKPDVNKALSIIKKIAEEKVDQVAQSQKTPDINLSIDQVDDIDKAFEPIFTRHKIELDLEIPEQQDFYDELVYLSELGLMLAKDTMSSSKKEGKKLFTLVLVDQPTEDKFKNELKYFRKIAKIRKSHPDAPLPKKYLEVAQNFSGEELQNALKNYYGEYESQIKSGLKIAGLNVEKLPYNNWGQEIRSAIEKSKIKFVDYQQLLSDLIELDYQPTAEIIDQLNQILAVLQSESHVIKSRLAKIQDYLEKNSFDNQLINYIKSLLSNLESFRTILLTKSSLKALSQDSDLDLTFNETFAKLKEFFNKKATKFYDQKYQ